MNELNAINGVDAEVASVERSVALSSMQRYQVVIPTLQLSDDKAAALIAPLADSEISIHPSKGFLYIAHGAARTRIIQAFGVGSLRMLASGPMLETAVDYVAYGTNKTAVSHSREYDVFVTGIFFGNYVGGTDMRGNKPSSTNAELEEAIKSDVWKSVAKELGVGLELGSPEFTKMHVERSYSKVGNVWGRKEIKNATAKPEYTQSFHQETMDTEAIAGKVNVITRNTVTKKVTATLVGDASIYVLGNDEIGTILKNAKESGLAVSLEVVAGTKNVVGAAPIAVESFQLGSLHGIGE